MTVATSTLKQLSQTALTNTLTTTLYTVPASTTTIVKEILLCNTDTVSRNVTIRMGASPATGVISTVLAALLMQPGETKTFSLSTNLLTTHLITGGASAGAVVSCTISGVEAT